MDLDQLAWKRTIRHLPFFQFSLEGIGSMHFALHLSISSIIHLRKMVREVVRSRPADHPAILCVHPATYEEASEYSYQDQRLAILGLHHALHRQAHDQPRYTPPRFAMHNTKLRYGPCFPSYPLFHITLALAYQISIHLPLGMLHRGNRTSWATAPCDSAES